MGTISLRFSDRDDILIRKYAQVHGMDISTFIRQAVMERIEDEYDLTLFNKVWEEEQDNERLSHDALKKELDL